MKQFRHRVLACGLVCVAAVIVGCGPEPKSAEPTKLPREFSQKDWATPEVPVSRVLRRDYRLREGDSLEIIYHVRHKQTEFYRIQTEDVLVIRFPFNSALNQVERVQSDGRVYLDLVGPAVVAGEKIGDVQKILEKKYATYIKEPTLTVSFKQSNVKIEELKKAITTSPRGQSRLVPVTPDGTISLPFIVDIQAAGRTISELHRNLNRAYREIGLWELEVTVNIQSVAPVRIYVLGEVRIPGALLNRTGAVNATGEITLLQAIAQAGSYISPRAELSKVMLVRRRNLPRPQIAVVNVFQLLENRTREAGKPVVADSSKHRFDIWLEDGDIIYVPTSAIARRADYIDYVWTRGIRAVSGFTSSATYSVGDAVDWLGPNP